jgi:uncharacterized protein YjbI with pentapeptide repeats
MHKDRSWLCQVFHHVKYRNEEFEQLVGAHQQGKGIAFDGCTFVDCNLEDFDFAGSSFTNCRFLNSRLVKVGLGDVSMQDVEFQGCHISETDFTGCVLDNKGVKLIACEVAGCSIPENSSFIIAD